MIREFLTKNGPYIKTTNTKLKIANQLFLTLGIIQIINIIINFKNIFSILLITIILPLLTITIEYSYNTIIKHNNKSIDYYIKETNSHILGLLLAIIIPVTTPIYISVIAGIVATFSKIIIKHNGKNIISPAIIGIITVILLSFLININLSFITFESFKTNILASLIGINAFSETSIIPLIVSFYLIYKQNIKYIIPITIIITIFIVALISTLITNQEITYVIYLTTTSSIIFSSCFLATDSITSPITKASQFIYGFIIAIITILLQNIFNVFGSIYFAILFANLLVPILNNLGIKIKYNKIYLYITIIITILITIVTSIII
ncbi:MAG: RnfABCDGE type electron transport complex subunit D [bacterium]|nr:RnfABCDGE type electron transport complex subunit D [bacterium]